MSDIAKKTLATGLLLPSLISTAFAADEDRDRSKRWGLVGGLSMSTVHSIPGAYAYRTGGLLKQPAVGISWHRPLKGTWTFVPELWYSHFGTSFGGGFISLSYDSISVPLMWRRYSPRHAPITPYFELGVVPSTIFPGKQTSLYYSYQLSVYPTDLIDVGFGLGTGVRFPVKNTFATINLRLNQGVVPRIGNGVAFNRRVTAYGGIYF